MITNNFQNDFLNIMKSGNPQELVMGMLQQKANQSPVYKNLITLVQQGDTQGVETVVRNIAKEKGIDFDKEFNSFKQMFRR